MRVTVELCEPDVVSTTAAHLVLKDPESGLPVAEIAIRGAGYVVLTEDEKRAVARMLLLGPRHLAFEGQDHIEVEFPDREGGYHGEPRLWEQVAAAQAEKRAASRGSGKVVKMGGKKVNVPQSLEDIAYPEGAKFGEDGIIIVPSRKGEDADGKKFRRACKRARAQQYAFLEAQKRPEAVEEGEVEEETDD